MQGVKRTPCTPAQGHRAASRRGIGILRWEDRHPELQDERGNNYVDEQTAPPRQLARNFANVIMDRIGEMTGEKATSVAYEKGSVHEVLNFTHDFVIAAFLYAVNNEYRELLESGKQTEAGKEDESAGIRFGEGFDIIVKGPRGVQNPNDIQMELFFRGATYPLDLKKVKQLAEEG